MKELGYICQHTFLSEFLNPQSVVVDFGAHEGEFSLAIIKRFGCRVYGAEPDPNFLRAMPSDPQMTVLPVAISGTNGSIRLNMFDGRDSSVLGAKPGEGSRTVTADAVTLTEFRRRVGISRIDLLKVDIEGAEIGLFENAAPEDLADIDQLAVEFHDFIYPHIHERVEAIKTQVASIGFWVLPFSMDNTDVLFINKRMPIGAARIAWLKGPVKYSRGVRRKFTRALLGRAA